MTARKKLITLLPQEGFETTTLGRALVWALTAGRVIVVLTELAVILAFLSRFWLDRTITDLNEEIGQKVSIIAANRSFEEQYNNLQSRLAVINKTSQADPGVLTNAVLAQVPPEVRLDELSITATDIQITGISLSEVGIELLVSQLEKTNLGNVALTKLTTKENEIGIKFGVAIDMKGAKEK